GKVDDCGHQYFWNGSDDGGPSCIVQVRRDHCTLNHQEVGAPISKREYKSQTEHETECVNTHRVVGSAVHSFPEMKLCIVYVLHDAFPSSSFVHTDDDQECDSEDDEEELEHFIVYCTGQTTQIGIHHHHSCSKPDGNIEVPAEDYLQQHRKSVERDARREDRHHSESERVEGSCLLIESKLEVFGYTSGSA